VTRHSARLAWGVVAASTAAAVGGVAVGAIGRGSTGDRITGFAGVAVFMSVSAVGGLIASRQPQNPIGWILCAFSAFTGLTAVAAGYAEIAPAHATHGAGQIAAWFADWAYVSFFALAILVLLVFPDGHLPSRRWRAAAWCGALGPLAFAGGSAFAPGRLHDYPRVRNPLGVGGALPTILGVTGIVMVIGGLATGVAAIVVRYRRAGGLQRQQIKWLALAGSFALVAVVVGGFLGSFGYETVGDTLIQLGVLGIPIAIGVAVLKYRLYDIDRIISRALVYGALSALLAGGYVAIVLGLQAAFGSLTQGNELAVACSTLAVAALFRPARRRVQNVVDRRFYRSKVNAEATLARFGTRLRREADLDALLAELYAVVGQTLAPAHVSLWLRSESEASRNDPETVAQ
jgi:MFS family permease